MKHIHKNMCTAFAVSLLAVISMVGCRTQSGTSVALLPPENRKPELVRPPRSYRIIDERTFPGYTNVQTAGPLRSCQTKSYPIIGIRRTPKATYVEYAWRPQNDWFWIRFESGTYLRDSDSGDCYKLREVEHFPVDTCFFVGQQAGETVKFVLVFPPLPDNVKKVDYIYSGGQTRGNMSFGSYVLDIDVRKLEKCSSQNAVSRPVGKIIY